VQAPPLPAKGAGGYGSEILARPGKSEVVFSRQMGAPRVRWLVYGLASGEFMEGRGLAGDLRDGVFDDAGAWLLASYGLCRVTFDPPAVAEVVKRGIGDHQHRLLGLSDSLLGLARLDGHTLLVVDAGSGEVRKRIRTPAPDLVLEDGAEAALLCSFRAGVTKRLDLRTLRISVVGDLPEAVSPLALDDRVVALTGPRVPWGRVQGLEGVSYLGWRTAPTAVVELDRRDLRVRREVDGASGLREVLGTDAEGRLIATAEWGLALVDAERLQVVERYDDERALGSACWIPEARAVVFLRHYLVAPPPGGFDPVPETLLVVRW
jgi:hypothetical protein